MVVTLDTCFDGGKGGALPARVIGVIVFICFLLPRWNIYYVGREMSTAMKFTNI